MIVPPNPIFTARETHGRVLRSGNRLIAHSQDAGWRSLHAAILEEAPFQANERPIRHPSLIYHLSRPTQVTRKIEGAASETALIGPRRICLTPGEASTLWGHSGHPEILQVYLRQSIYEAAVTEIYGCDSSGAELVPRFAILDPLLEQLAIAITNALRDGAAEDGLYIDTIAQMMAVHLARSHSSRSRPVRLLPTKPLAGWKMRRVIEYIEDNLEGDLSLQAMAAEVDISPLYLARAFKSAVGQSPHQYVLARRIERAKELLRNTDLPVVDVALSSGFSSQSHLSHWFIRQVGVSPAVYRRQATG
ncbi:MAG TPA: AraC family transcriptional regulator [Bryobacteraceae bacterium]|nr:AraC family transcriptional regulator [Bryobacteraceae bacterium]